MQRRAALSLLLPLLFLPAVQAQSTPDARQILAKAKSAAGGTAWDSIKTIYLRGQAKISGIDTNLEDWTDLTTLRHVERAAKGPIKAARGFDGKTFWQQLPPAQQVTTKTDNVISFAYRRSFTFFFPERWEAKFTYQGTRQEQERTFYLVEVSPKNGIPFVMWIDSTTYLLNRTVSSSGVTFTYANYRIVNGVKLPFLIQGPDQILSFEQAQFNLPVTDDLFLVPTLPAPRRR
ncbi:outer membrane lipoprotein-sorting protein [Anthocerotibacter panamensis]|uniref:outer membrane lipoprotein-sorting protein n=1 Tax=Anthocerotibacter panamensis TaxID=2857077 RepID=UPI001C4076E6|nr:outer membrane lipoprotein-sorting protein [Anthocerotibacter panamensis]